MPARQLELTEQALRTLIKMQDQLSLIGDAFGIGSPEWSTAAKSLVDVLMMMLHLGGHISAEDDLSLLSTGSLTYGVIWHRKADSDCAGSWSTHS